MKCQIIQSVIKENKQIVIQAPIKKMDIDNIIADNPPFLDDVQKTELFDTNYSPIEILGIFLDKIIKTLNKNTNKYMYELIYQK